jgi:hypothetical protein
VFVDWVKTRRPTDWLLRVLECLPMSTAAFDNLHLYAVPPTDDPVLLAQRRKLAEWVFEATPGLREDVVHDIQLQDARGALRSVLKVRQIALGTDEKARVDACDDLATLKRWHDQAVVAANAAEALR